MKTAQLRNTSIRSSFRSDLHSWRGSNRLSTTPLKSTLGCGSPPGSRQAPAFTLKNILDEDDVFGDLVDLPSVFPLFVRNSRVRHSARDHAGPVVPSYCHICSSWHSDLDGMRESIARKLLVCSRRSTSVPKT